MQVEQMRPVVLATGLALLAGCAAPTHPAGATGTAGATPAAGVAGAAGAAGAGGGVPSVSGSGAGAAGAGGLAGVGGDAAGTGGASAAGAGRAPDAGVAAPEGGRADAEDATEGGADGAAAGLTLPVHRGELYVLELGALVFTVNPAIGARIVSVKLDGDELLTDATANARFYGSTLWTSPASDWVIGAFDPPSVVDRDPYTTTVSADGVITASNVPSTVNGKRFTITKVFRADLANQAIIIDYKITNNGAAAFRLSHWEVTRVFPDGLTFFPTGSSAKVDFLPQSMQLTQAGGYTWYDNTTHLASKGESKAGAETLGGFIAHDAPHARGDILFLKVFKDVAPTAAPPGHFEVELFSADAHTYVELEDHSSYDQILPGQTYTQTVRWILRRLPAGTDRRAGSAALLAAVKNALGM